MEKITDQPVSLTDAKILADAEAAGYDANVDDNGPGLKIDPPDTSEHGDPFHR